MRGFAGIAQLVERVIRNDEVVGSIPISGTSENKGLHGIAAQALFVSTMCVVYVRPPKRYIPSRSLG